METLSQNFIEQHVAKHLDAFYQRRLAKLSSLKLREVLKRKNPYLFKAIGIDSVLELIDELLRAYMSSSDEGIFGDAFFEPLARDIAQGQYAAGAGVDVVVETDTHFKAFAVKSGTSVFNVQSRKRQEEEFNKMRNRLYKINKNFDPIVGYCYGKKKSKSESKVFREVAGQMFWEELSGDPECYLKILRAMQDAPSRHKEQFRAEWVLAINRFGTEFGINFCLPSGKIDWEKLLEFNSGNKDIKWVSVHSVVTV